MPSSHTKARVAVSIKQFDGWLQGPTAGQTKEPANIRGVQVRDLRILAERELKCTIAE